MVTYISERFTYKMGGRKMAGAVTLCTRWAKKIRTVFDSRQLLVAMT